jgi:acyl carrier protein
LKILNDRTDAIRAFMSRLLVEKGDTRPFRDDEALVTGARLDSLDVTTMIAFVEQSFRVDFAALDFDQGVFDSVDSLSAFVAASAPAVTD